MNQKGLCFAITILNILKVIKLQKVVLMKVKTIVMNKQKKIRIIII